MLGVHPGGLARRDPEEVGVEPVDLIEESAAGEGRSAALRVRRIRDSPSPSIDIGRRRPAGKGPTDSRPSRRELPERLGARRPGEPAADPDDGDRLAVRPTPPTSRPGSRGDGLAGRGQVAAQLLDRRMLVDEGRVQATAQPVLQLTGQGNRLDRPQAIARQWLPRVDLVGPEAERPGDPRGKPRRDLLPRRRPRCGPGSDGGLGDALGVGPGPSRHDFERPVEERLATGVALELAARRLGQARAPEEPHGGHFELVVLGDGPAYRRDHLVPAVARAEPLDLEQDGQTLLPLRFDRDRPRNSQPAPRGGSVRRSPRHRAGTRSARR